MQGRIEILKKRVKEIREKGETVKILPVGEIRPWPKQPRIYFDKDSIKNLAKSIEQVGQKVPILVAVDPANPGCFVIIDGERRWRACQLIKRTTIRAIIITQQEDDDDRLVRSVVANFGREGHTPYEVALVLRRIYETRKYTVDQIAAIFARSNCWVYQHLSLTKLDQRVIAMMDYNNPFESRLKFAIAILLADLPPDLQFEIAKHIVDNKMRLKAARHYAETKAAENKYKIGMVSRPERRKSSLMSLFVLTAESLPAFLEDSFPLQNFLCSFSDEDLGKLEKLAEQCQNGIKTLYDAIKIALTEKK